MASNIKGLDTFLGKLNNASKDFLEEVKVIISINIGDMEKQAHDEAPGASDMIATEFGPENEKDIREAKDRGWDPIDQSIFAEIYEGGFGGRVGVNENAGDLAAWIEFSTGQNATKYLSTVPEEWRAAAEKFYINGQGTIIGKPYLLPAFEKYSLQTVKELKQAIKDIKL